MALLELDNGMIAPGQCDISPIVISLLRQNKNTTFTGGSIIGMEEWKLERRKLDKSLGMLVVPQAPA